MTQQKNSGSVLVWEGSKRSEEPSHRSCSEANRLSTPDPEVVEKARRRRFSARYKLKVLEEADRCSQPGEVGVLLRREALYWSNLQTWRKQREEGSLQGLSPKTRGRKSEPRNPLAGKVKALERENRRLQRKLQRTEILLDIQKKASELLEIPLQTVEDEEDD